jgi:hypothetical protein
MKQIRDDEYQDFIELSLADMKRRFEEYHRNPDNENYADLTVAMQRHWRLVNETGCPWTSIRAEDSEDKNKVMKENLNRLREL